MSTYDAVANYSTTMNPNGVWSYGELPSETAVSAFSVYPTEGALDFGAPGWSTGSGSPPYVGVNNTGSPITGRGVTLPSGDLAMHPGASGEYSDTRFTVPGAGPVSATFTFAGLETGTSTDVHVLYNGTSMADGTIAGYSTFSNTISIPAAAAGDTLDFIVGYGNDQSYIGDATSLTAQVTASGNKLAFIQSPDDTAVNAVIKPPITVQVQDSSGNDQTTAADLVTLGIQSGPGVLKGTLTEPAVNGLATFSDLAIDQSGDYYLKATDASNPNTDSGVSNQFKITAGKLVFAPAPKNGSADSPLKTIKVELRDGKNKLITDADGTVITLAPAGALSGSEISGNTAVLSGGIATFSNVVLHAPGTYQLQADDGADAVATSGKFKVDGDKLAISNLPKTVDAGAPFTFTVSLKNQRGALVDFEDSIDITIADQTDPTVSLTTTSNFLSGGTATFQTTLLHAGKFLLTAADTTGISGAGTSGVADATATFTVLGLHLAYQRLPKSVNAGDPIEFGVVVLDSKGKVASSNSDQIQLTATPTFNSPTQYVHQAALAGGRVDFGAGDNAIAIAKPGTYTQVVSDVTNPPTTGGGGVASASARLTVLGLHLAYEQLPKTVDAGAPFQFRVLLLNSKGKIETNADDPIQLTATPTFSGGTVQFVHQDSLINGVKDYTTADTGFSIRIPGTYQQVVTDLSTPATSTTISPVADATSALTVLPLHLALSGLPRTVVTGGTYGFRVELLDSNGKIDSTDDDALQVNTVLSTNVAVGFTHHDALVDGIRQFNSAAGDNFVAEAPGTYTVTVYDSTSVNDPQDNPPVASATATLIVLPAKSSRAEGLRPERFDTLPTMPNAVQLAGG